MASLERMKTWKKGEATDADLIDQMLRSIPDEELGLESARRRRAKSNPKNADLDQVTTPRQKENFEERLTKVTKQNAQYAAQIGELKTQMGLQDKILDAVDNVNSLISFKMADLVNKAVKAGRYAEVFQDEGVNEESAEAGQAENNWLQQLA